MNLPDTEVQARLRVKSCMQHPHKGKCCRAATQIQAQDYAQLQNLHKPFWRRLGAMHAHTRNRKNCWECSCTPCKDDISQGHRSIAMPAPV